VKREERAQQIWQVLVSAAHDHQIITYAEVADLIGMGAGTLAGPLGCVMYYCQQQGLPALTSVVVRKQAGTPGVGLTSVEPDQLDSERQKVFRRTWFDNVPPSADALAKAYSAGEGE
jgi:alkylated DNA nucleotide flippase Atl1